MLVFLILPSIAWLDCGPVDATKRGYAALQHHLGRFAAGLILSEVVALIISLPLTVFFYIVDGGNHSVPDVVWLGVIFYGAFGWSFVIYIEQMFAAELFLWHLKWTTENEKRESLNLPPVSLDDIKRPDLLDDVSDLLSVKTKA